MNLRVRPSEDTSAPINASDILQAWDNFLGIGNSINVLTTTALSLAWARTRQILIPGHDRLDVEQHLQPRPQRAHALGTRAVNALQALLTIPRSTIAKLDFIERNAVSSLSSNVLLWQLPRTLPSQMASSAIALYSLPWPGIKSSLAAPRSYHM